jgi:lysophospholipase L1-like esterase
VKGKYRILLIISMALNILLISAGGLFIYHKGGLSYIFQKSSNRSFLLNHYIEKSEYESLSISNKSIVFFGDSLTDFGQWNEELKRPNVVNRGISGDTTTGLLDRLSEIVKGKPNKLFIMIGVNDLIAGITPETIISNYEKIVGTIQTQSPNTNIYVQSILPVNEKMYHKNYPSQRPVTNADIESLNSLLKKLSHKKEVHYVNLHPSFVNNGMLIPEYTVDGVHLNGSGYKVWTKIIKKYVQ